MAERPSNPLRACDGVTLKGRLCRRRASVEYNLRDGSTRAYCSAHDDGRGAMRYLRPYPWQIVDDADQRADNSARAFAEGPFAGSW